MKTKITLILLGLGLSAATAYAAHADELPLPVSNSINVTAPDQSGMWSFGAMALLMQPTNNGFAYADNTTYTAGMDDSTQDNNYQRVDSNYHWWFGADITYAFPGNGRDVTLAYEGLQGENSNSATGPASNPQDLPNFSGMISTFSSYAYENAAGKTQSNYDAVDLLLGQKLDVGTRLRLHPFLGVRYAYINVKDSAQYSNGYSDYQYAPGTVDAESGALKNTFNGVGPRFGSDATVDLGKGFSIRGRLGLSVLIGSHQVDDSYVVTVVDPDTGDVLGEPVANNDGSPNSGTRAILEMDGRLGLNYTYSMSDTTALGFEAGWQAVNYFNAISDHYQTVQAWIPGENYEHTSNFGLQGPYARVQLDIA